MAATAFIAAGVLVLALWAASSLVVRTVSNGSVFSEIAASALHSPAIQDLVKEKAREAVDSEFASAGVDPTAEGFNDQIESALTQLVESDSFVDELLNQIREAEKSFQAALTDPNRAPGPLTIAIDFDGLVTDAVADLPGVGAAIGDVESEPVDVPVLSAEEVETVRDGYSWADRLATWGLVLAVALIGIGILIAPRKRWILPRIFLGIGILALALWFGASRITSDWIASHVPGGTEGDAAEWIRDVVPQDRLDDVARALLTIAIAFLAAAAVLTALVLVLPRLKRKRQLGEDAWDERPETRSERRRDEHRAPEPAAVPSPYAAQPQAPYAAPAQAPYVAPAQAPAQAQAPHAAPAQAQAPYVAPAQAPAQAQAPPIAQPQALYVAPAEAPYAAQQDSSAPVWPPLSEGPAEPMPASPYAPAEAEAPVEAEGDWGAPDENTGIPPVENPSIPEDRGVAQA